MYPKKGIKQWKTDPCIIYRENKLGTVIVIVYVEDTLGIGNEPALMNIIELINKYYVTRSMGGLGEFIGCTIKRDLTNMNLKISQTHIINNKF